MNMGETRRNGTTGIVIGMAWTTGILGTKDVTMEDTGDSTTKSVNLFSLDLSDGRGNRLYITLL